MTQQPLSDQVEEGTLRTSGGRAGGLNPQTPRWAAMVIGQHGALGAQGEPLALGRASQDSGSWWNLGHSLWAEGAGQAAGSAGPAGPATASDSLWDTGQAPLLAEPPSPHLQTGGAGVWVGLHWAPGAPQVCRPGLQLRGGSLSASPRFGVGSDPGTAVQRPVHGGGGQADPSRAAASAGPGSQPRLLGQQRGPLPCSPPPPQGTAPMELLPSAAPWWLQGHMAAQPKTWAPRARRCPQQQSWLRPPPALLFHRVSPPSLSRMPS